MNTAWVSPLEPHCLMKAAEVWLYTTTLLTLSPHEANKRPLLVSNARTDLPLPASPDAGTYVGANDVTTAPPAVILPRRKRGVGSLPASR